MKTVSTSKLETLGFKRNHIGRYIKTYPSSVDERMRKYEFVINYKNDCEGIYYAISLTDERLWAVPFAFYSDSCEELDEAEQLLKAIREFRQDLEELRNGK